MCGKMEATTVYIVCLLILFRCFNYALPLYGTFLLNINRSTDPPTRFCGMMGQDKSCLYIA